MNTLFGKDEPAPLKPQRVVMQVEVWEKRDPWDLLLDCVRVHWHTMYPITVINRMGPTWTAYALERIEAGYCTPTLLFDPSKKWRLKV
jgi:hypothetical protein